MSEKHPYYDIPLGVCALSRKIPDQNILFANPAGELLASAIEDGLCGELLDELKSDDPPREYIVSLKNPENIGTIRNKNWMKVTISEGDLFDEPVFFLWATDISADKEAEKQLREAVEIADKTAEAKANFLATMSHEIRTPMQSVYGLLELIGEEKPSDNIVAMVNTAKNSSSALLRILDDILDMAKIDADKMELDEFEVPVRTLVRGTIEAMTAKIYDKKVDIVDDIAKEVPFVIMGDPQRLRQILINLLGNATKFTDEGRITVKVTLETAEIFIPQGKIGIRVEVTDTGIGMSPEVASKLFTAFTQADSSTSRKYGGTGLGLSICKKLIELMGGKIGVISKEGLGSTFWFEIPTEEISVSENTVKLPVLDGITVISVEDHPMGAKEVVRSLQSMGAIVDNVSTCKDAIELIRKKPYDVGVIDQGLPDGLGLDLIRDIIKLRPFMGMVMYTVRDDIGLAHSLKSLGAFYLTKPASRIGLGHAVKAAAESAHKMDKCGPDRLLIAEDTDSVRDLLSRQLKKLNVEADFVENGAQALEALKSGQYGIMFTDLHMPDVDGYSLVKQIRETEEGNGNNRHFPIVVLTADVHMAQRDVYMSYGFDECLLKPVTLGQFRRLLIRWGLLEDKEPQQAEPEKNTENHIENEKNDNSEQAYQAIDRELVVKQLGSFDQDTVEMLKMFIKMTLPLIEQLKNAKQEHNHYEIKEIAHSLKGSSRSACAVNLGNICEKIQDTAERKGNCLDLIDQAVAEFDLVIKDIESI